MEYWIVKVNRYNNSKYFHCDYISDIDDLPTYTHEGKKQENDTISSYKTTPGSQCLCQEDGSVWLLGKDIDSWIKQNNNSSSGISFCNGEPLELSNGMVWIDG